MSSSKVCYFSQWKSLETVFVFCIQSCRLHSCCQCLRNPDRIMRPRLDMVSNNCQLHTVKSSHPPKTLSIVIHPHQTPQSHMKPEQISSELHCQLVMYSSCLAVNAQYHLVCPILLKAAPLYTDFFILSDFWVGVHPSTWIAADPIRHKIRTKEHPTLHDNLIRFSV